MHTNQTAFDSDSRRVHPRVPRESASGAFCLPMKSPQQYEAEIASLKRMVATLKEQAVKALEAYVAEMEKVKELSK